MYLQCRCAGHYQARMKAGAEQRETLQIFPQQIDVTSHLLSIISSLSLSPHHSNSVPGEPNPFVADSTESNGYLSPLYVSCVNMADGTGQRDHPGAGAIPERSNAESLVKRRQFLPPVCCNPGAFMQKDECWKYHLPCANLGLKVHFVPVKADPSSDSNPSDVAFICHQCHEAFVNANSIHDFLWGRVIRTATNIPSSAHLYHQKSEMFNVIINRPLFIIHYSLQGC